MTRIAGVLSLLMLCGCEFFISGEGDAPADTKPAAVAPGAAAPGKRDPIDEAIARQEEYSYNPIGKRDPFRSFLNTTDGRKVAETSSPLQKYEIDQYQLVGIIWGVERSRALVQDPEGVGHVMEIGTYIGKNWGKVTQINSSEVVVTEEFQTMEGELVVNNINMTLPGVADRSKK